MKLELFRKLVAKQIDEFEKISDTDKFKPNQTNAQIQKYGEILKQALACDGGEIIHEIAYYLYQRSVLELLFGKCVKMLNENVLPNFNNAHNYISSLKDANQYLVSNINKTALDRKKGAKARHEKDPKQEEKRIVKECWDAWQINPNQYKNNTKFAQDMLKKFEPDNPKENDKHLNSEKVITD